jgi:broad specificity phosphatase PhoE
VAASTDAADAGVLAGWSDAPLNASGRQQARDIARRVPSDLAAVYTSSLSRAIETAQIATDLPSPPSTGRFSITSMPELRPRNVGPFVGAPVDDPVFLRRRSRPDDDLGGAETLSQYRTRLASAVATIRERHQSGAILVVAHASTVNEVLAALMGSEVRMEIKPRPGDVFVTGLQNDGALALETLASTAPAR